MNDSDKSTPHGPCHINHEGSEKNDAFGSQSQGKGLPEEKELEAGSGPGTVEEGNDNNSPDDAPYSVFPERKKIYIMLMASFSSLISPISSSIYYPALDDFARDMHVSVSMINLSVTTYLIFQGIAPSFLGSFSDVYGRRPAFLICFIIYLGANIGLALQDNYAALMVLRCLQSSGSSGTIAIGSAAVADLSTRAERGKYLGYATIATTLGPALGPVIGGLLEQFLGWKAIFWFLVIFSACMFVLFVVTVPETCRAVVGNGSISPARWNLSLWQLLRPERRQPRADYEIDHDTVQKGKKRPNPFSSLTIIFEKECGIILFFSALLFSGYTAVVSTLSTELTKRYQFNAVQVGLCYLPFGAGSMLSRWTVGALLDWNFRRGAKRQGLRIEKNRQQDISTFDIEKARLIVTLPAVYLGCLGIIAYGWVMEYRTNLAGPLILLFVLGNTVTGAFSSLNVVVVDIHRDSPATAVAANNLLRCLMGAGAAALAIPLINRIGIGWTGTFVAGLWAVFSSSLWVVFQWGYSWRKKAHCDKSRE